MNNFSQESYKVSFKNVNKVTLKGIKIIQMSKSYCFIITYVQINIRYIDQREFISANKDLIYGQCDSYEKFTVLMRFTNKGPMLNSS